MLTDREKKIFEFLKKEIREKGYPPTVREVCAAVGIKSTSTVHKDLRRLAEEGYLKKDPSKPRALMLIDKDAGNTAVEHNSAAGPAAYNPTEAAGGESIVRERNDIIDVPVVGRIAAGQPILASENIDDSFPLPARFADNGTNFMLNVKGESMVEAGIMDGDYILVHQQNTASNGDIVVAMIDGFESEATVKTFYKEDGHFRLQPENSTMSPIIVNEVQILGKVKGVFRYF